MPLPKRTKPTSVNLTPGDRYKAALSENDGNEKGTGQYDKKLQITLSTIAGNGVITTEKIDSGDFVCEYIGEAINGKQNVNNVSSNYFVTFGKKANVGIDAEDSKYKIYFGRNINYGKKDANLTPKWIMLDNKWQMFFIAKRNINANEELLWDYESGFTNIPENANMYFMRKKIEDITGWEII
jgi:hypothetical protein